MDCNHKGYAPLSRLNELRDAYDALAPLGISPLISDDELADNLAAAMLGRKSKRLEDNQTPIGPEKTTKTI